MTRKNYKNALLNMITAGFETDVTKFPADICTLQDKYEPEVFNSPDDALYVCVVTDKRFNDALEVRILKPYLCKVEDWKELGLPSGTMYAWCNDAAQEYVDHGNNGVHGDPNVVVAWRKLEAADES